MVALAAAPLTCRVVGAIFCLGAAGVAVLVDRRWVMLRLMVQVEVLIWTLMLIAAVPARAELFPQRPLTWVLLGGFLFVLVGSGYLWRRNEGDRSSGPCGSDSPRCRYDLPQALLAVIPEHDFTQADLIASRAPGAHVDVMQRPCLSQVRSTVWPMEGIPAPREPCPH